MWRRWAALGIAALLCGACASTAQQSGQQSSLASGAANVGGADSRADGGSAVDGAAGADGAASGGAAGGAGRTASQAAASVRGAASRIPQGAVSGRGFTKDTIYIGYVTWKDVSRAGGAVGYAVDYGDQEQIARAIVDDINGHGGIAGRRVVINFYDYKTSDVLANTAAGDQAACDALTVDHPSFAVVAVTGILSEVLPDCLAKHQTPLIANNNIPFVKEAFTRWAPYFYSTASPMTERYIPVWLRRSAAERYFTGWDTTNGGPGAAPVKVGILSTEGPAGDTFIALIKAELAQQHVEVASTYSLSSPFDTSGISSAILRFRQANVTHVIPDGLNLLLFPQSAESQRYRPRYLISTAQAPILIQSAVGANQLRGTLGVGYYASYDVATAQDPGDPSPAAAHCRAVEKAAGGDPNQRESWNLMGKACDGFNFLVDAVAHGGLSPAGLRAGANAIQTVPPAGAFAINLAAGRYDGIAGVRDLGYNDACSCFMFLSKTTYPL